MYLTASDSVTSTFSHVAPMNDFWVDKKMIFGLNRYKYVFR